ncbi:MAG: hypothetical protein CMF61_07115 [Magnetococcales bacterium]|nr:hypothetical protein [Magnetococcales bacterium]PPR18925.1 MAG: hypothetical protein CFH43_00388 [Pseudomonadota bacterium]
MFKLSTLFMEEIFTDGGAGMPSAASSNIQSQLCKFFDTKNDQEYIARAIAMMQNLKQTGYEPEFLTYAQIEARLKKTLIALGEYETVDTAITSLEQQAKLCEQQAESQINPIYFDLHTYNAHITNQKNWQKLADNLKADMGFCKQMVEKYGPVYIQTLQK